MYVKVKNNQIEKYPYNMSDFRNDYPNVTLPKSYTPSSLAEYNVFLVKLERGIGEYNPLTHKIVNASTPTLINGVWTITRTLVEMPYEEQLMVVERERKKEYPPVDEYMDGLVKGSNSQMQDYINKCLEVKLRYPKPTPNNP